MFSTRELEERKAHLTAAIAQEGRRRGRRGHDGKRRKLAKQGRTEPLCR
jgi:hypothetical protein